MMRRSSKAAMTKNALAFNNRGLAKLALGHKQASIEDFNRAITADPKYATAFFNRGLIKAELGDNQGSVDDYNQAVAINPALRAKASTQK
jgi:tetratricopeptide (TPR) repeat protein